MGPHWELSKEEARALGEATDAFLKSLPAKQRSKVAKALAQYLPMITFASTIGMITYPRIELTMQLKARSHAIPENPERLEGHGDPAGGNGRAAGPSYRDAIGRIVNQSKG